MSRKITEQDFLKRFYTKYPESKIEVIEYTSLKKTCIIRCQKCGKEFSKGRAESFLSSWNCCGGHNEKKVEMIRRLCEKDGHYQFIKQLDAKYVIIKHLDCGNELIKSIQGAIGSYCSCSICDTRSDRLRISLKDAQSQLDEKFNKELICLFFDGVDSKKSQYRCNKCGLIFNQSHYNLLTKGKGCPKCDRKRAKSERAAQKTQKNIIMK